MTGLWEVYTVYTTNLLQLTYYSKIHMSPENHTVLISSAYVTNGMISACAHRLESGSDTDSRLSVHPKNDMVKLLSRVILLTALLPGFRMSCVSGLITARVSNVGLALLDELAAEGFGYDASLMEVCHKLPRDLQHKQASQCSIVHICSSTHRAGLSHSGSKAGSWP